MIDSNDCLLALERIQSDLKQHRIQNLTLKHHIGELLTIIKLFERRYDVTILKQDQYIEIATDAGLADLDWPEVELYLQKGIAIDNVRAKYEIRKKEFNKK